MASINLAAGWVAILTGLLFGAVTGTFFHRQEWLEGYGSWRRRMLRLTHISLVGTGLLNLSFALSVDLLELQTVPPIASLLFLVGAVAMPLVCLLSAWQIVFRHLFFIPVVSLVLATVDFICRGILS
jgi:hypothetical protein